MPRMPAESDDYSDTEDEGPLLESPYDDGDDVAQDEEGEG